jgi:hypothetical protein
MIIKNKRGFSANIPYKNGFAGKAQMQEVLGRVLTVTLL